MNQATRNFKIISAIELVIAALAIILDLWIPTLVILALIAASFLLRKEKLSSLGFKKPSNLLKMTLIVLLLALAWTAIQFSITLPILNHAFGTTQNLNPYENLKGNVGSLAYFLFLTWTLAAFGEEIVYRGYLQKRVCDVFGKAYVGIFLAVAFSSILFGVAHLEQGAIGFFVTLIDALFFSFIKLRFNNNLFASILAHGFNNAIGIVTFFLIGPVYGLW
jgi:membrane protease YdiL (CAAX protease family)